MNQTQRKYLIDKIQDKAKVTDEELRKSLPEEPMLDGYLLRALLSGTLKITNQEKLLSVLSERAQRSMKGWLSQDAWRTERIKYVSFLLEDFFEIPEQYIIDYRSWKLSEEHIELQRRTLRATSEGLCTRIQLASNKTLEKMIAEVDDMGDISLVDCTLKTLLANSSESKLIDE